MTWLLLFTMSAITFINRYLFLTRSIAYMPGPKLKRLLSYSSFSILTAIWVPLVFKLDGQAGIQFVSVDYLVGATVAAVLSYFRIGSIIVVLASVSVFFAIRYF